MNELYLNAIEIEPIPSHCNIIALCSNCTKRKVCAFQEDYLKIARKIEWLLGDPQKDRELLEKDDGFTGIPFPDNSIFPQTIIAIRNNNSIEVNDLTGTFLSAKWSSLNKVKLLYEIEKYYIIFTFSYDEQFNKFVADIGTELYYGIQYIMSDSSIEEIIPIITEWRDEQKRKEEEMDIDIINTTFFSARLNCSQFEEDKKRFIKSDFKNHNNDIKDGYQFVASYHIENQHIKPAISSSKPVDLTYPWFIPVPAPKPPKPKPKRRDEF